MIDMFDFTQAETSQFKGLSKTTNKSSAFRADLKQLKILQGFDEIYEIAKSAFEFSHYFRKLRRFTGN